MESLPRDPPGKDANHVLCLIATKSILLFSVLCLALQFQQCAKEVVTYIFLYVHDIKIVEKQQVFPIWKLPPPSFAVINYSFSFVTTLSLEPRVL